MNMLTPPPGPQRAPLAAFARLPARTGARPPLSAVLDALRAEDEQTRRESARLAEIIGRIAGANRVDIDAVEGIGRSAVRS